MDNIHQYNGLTIIVEKSGDTYHTLDDWGLYVTNTDYVKEPKQVKNMIYIPGRDGYLDLSEAIAGHMIYSSREINIQLQGIRAKERWNSVLSEFRNKINGRVCHFIFDNDKSWYWRGRVSIEGFSSALKIGSLSIKMPEAEPYKYSITASNEPWLWDPFNFETDMITQIGEITVSSSETVTIPAGNMYTSPTFICRSITSSTFKVSDGTTEITLANGSNRDPRIKVNGDKDVELTFTGSGKVQIVYRGGSL